MARIHYDILQIKPDATSEEIQHAYRRLAQRYHPDHNPGAAAASQMAVINEAYEIVQAAPLRPSPLDDLTLAILGAARAAIQRSGWAVHRDDGTNTVFETGKPPVRVVLTSRLSNASLLHLSREYRDLAAVLAVHLDGSLAAGPRLPVVDLMHAKLYGGMIPRAPCKSLLSMFL